MHSHKMNIARNKQTDIVSCKIGVNQQCLLTYTAEKWKKVYTFDATVDEKFTVSGNQFETLIYDAFQ